jgi:hypothetical protein
MDFRFGAAQPCYHLENFMIDETYGRTRTEWEKKLKNLKLLERRVQQGTAELTNAVERFMSVILGIITAVEQHQIEKARFLAQEHVLRNCKYLKEREMQGFANHS